jgi:hypothetical protein
MTISMYAGAATLLALLALAAVGIGGAAGVAGCSRSRCFRTDARWRPPA